MVKSKQFRHIRVRHGFSEEVVVARSRNVVSLATLRLIESGEIEPSPQQLRVLARVYRVPYVHLLIIQGYLTPAELRRYSEVQGPQKKAA